MIHQRRLLLCKAGVARYGYRTLRSSFPRYSSCVPQAQLSLTFTESYRMPGSSILQTHCRRQAAPGHPAGSVIGRGSEFHAELARCRWALNSQGMPWQGGLCEDAGRVIAKITRYCPRNGLTGAMSEATEVDAGERRTLFRVFFWRYNIQGKALWSPSSIDTPLQTKGFLKRECVIECQQLRTTVIHADGGQIEASMVPGKVEVTKDCLWRRCRKPWHKGSLFRPFA